MPGVKAILPTLRRRLSTGDIFKPARKLVKLSLHIRKDFITRVASKNVWVILAPSNGLIAIMNWFQKVSLNEMSGKVLTSPCYKFKIARKGNRQTVKSRMADVLFTYSTCSNSFSQKYIHKIHCFHSFLRIQYLYGKYF